MYKYNNIDLFDHGKKVDNITFSYHRGDIRISDIYFRNLEIINASDFIIFFVRKNKEGGAKKALAYAKTKRKKHINLGI